MYFCENRKEYDYGGGYDIFWLMDVFIKIVKMLEDLREEIGV